MVHVAPDGGALAVAVQAHAHGATVALRVVPRAPRTELAGRYGERVKLKVKAPPVDGAANDAVRRFLAERCRVPTADVQLLQGARSRDKLVLVHDVTAAALRSALS